MTVARIKDRNQRSKRALVRGGLAVRAKSERSEDMNVRKQYHAPVLETFGTVRELTLDQDKVYGSTDGYSLNQIPIKDAGGSSATSRVG